MLTAIYEGLRRTHGVTMGIAGMILAFIMWKFAPNSKIDLFWLAPLIIIPSIFIIGLIDACRQLATIKTQPLPKVKAFRESYPPFEQASGVLLIEPSALYAFNSEVSVYLDVGGFEVPVGIGYVLNIQQNQLVQVLITQLFSKNAEDKTWEDVKNNNHDALARLLVRPSKIMSLIDTNDA
ncbi:MAG: hypothetical protein ACSHX6_11750 [Akkermansiaceae bacterium]